MRTLLLALVACAESHSAPPPDTQDVAQVVAQLDQRLQGVQLVAQLDQGRNVYTESCAGCHGDAGQGTGDGPAIYGPGALALAPSEGSKRDLLFRSAADVLAWVTKAMPADDPASLSAEQYVAVTAFIVTAHGVALERPLDAANAHAVALQPF
jgi:mono/diheme cytochrome c family protein